MIVCGSSLGPKLSKERLCSAVPYLRTIQERQSAVGKIKTSVIPGGWKRAQHLTPVAGGPVRFNISLTVTFKLLLFFFFDPLF